MSNGMRFFMIVLASAIWGPLLAFVIDRGLHLQPSWGFAAVMVGNVAFALVAVAPWERSSGSAKPHRHNARDGA